MKKLILIIGLFVLVACNPTTKPNRVNSSQSGGGNDDNTEIPTPPDSGDGSVTPTPPPVTPPDNGNGSGGNGGDNGNGGGSVTPPPTPEPPVKEEVHDYVIRNWYGNSAQHYLLKVTNNNWEAHQKMLDDQWRQQVAWRILVKNGNHNWNYKFDHLANQQWMDKGRTVNKTFLRAVVIKYGNDRSSMHGHDMLAGIYRVDREDNASAPQGEYEIMVMDTGRTGDYWINGNSGMPTMARYHFNYDYNVKWNNGIREELFDFMNKPHAFLSHPNFHKHHINKIKDLEQMRSVMAWYYESGDR